MRGVLAPVVTPFKADLSADRERLIAHCKWLLSQDCGLAVFGTNSEATSLTMDERFELIDALVEAGIDPSPMMPGTGCCSSCGDCTRLRQFYIYSLVKQDSIILSLIHI